MSFNVIWGQGTFPTYSLYKWPSSFPCLLLARFKFHPFFLEENININPHNINTILNMSLQTQNSYRHLPSSWPGTLPPLCMISFFRMNKQLTYLPFFFHGKSQFVYKSKISRMNEAPEQVGDLNLCILPFSCQDLYF